MEKRVQHYIEALSKMINVPTISSRDYFNKEIFDSFHNLLKESFPFLFKNFKYEEFDGSILLSYNASSNKNPVLLMSHHDVVEPNGKWINEPFNAKVINNKIYGRGTLDTKQNLWAILTAIEELLSEGYKFNRSIYIESSCNEETTSEGADKIAQELKRRNVHFDFTLDEGGFIVYDPIGGADGYFAMIALGEKDCIDLKFKAKSKGGHSSTPDKNTPLIRLAKLMLYIENHNIFKPHLSDVNCEMFKKMSLKMKGFLKFIFSKSFFFRPLLTKLLTHFGPTGKAMVTTTICFTKAKGSDGYNVIPEEAYVTGNIRLSHNDNKEKIINKLTKIAKKFDVEVEIMDGGYSSPICNFKNEQFKFLEDCITSNFKDVIVSPYISDGASDSKFFNQLSENVFRFAPFIVSNEQLETIHGKDENIDINTLEPAVDFYKDLLKRI